MPKLSDILSSEENRQFIIKSAKEYGFENVRVYIDVDNGPLLYLLVAGIRGEKHYASALSGVISDKLQCPTSILVETRLDEIQAPSIKENSFSILNYNPELIEQKINRALNEIEIDPLAKDASDMFEVERRLKLAQKITAERKKSLIHSDPKAETYPTKRKAEGNEKVDINEGKEKFIKQLDDPEKLQTLKEVIYSLPDDLFLKIEKSYQDKIISFTPDSKKLTSSS